MLERAAWQLRAGSSVTDAAFGGRLRVGRGVQPRLHQGLRAPAQRAAGRGAATGCRRPTASTSTRPCRCGCTAGATDEPARPELAGPPRPRRHPRPAGRRQAAWTRSATAPSGCPTSAWSRLRGARALAGPAARAAGVHQGGLGRLDRRRRPADPRRRRRTGPGRAPRARGRRLAGRAARPRAPRRVGRQRRRRALRPARELRPGQRRRPRPDVLRPAPRPGPPAAARGRRPRRRRRPHRVARGDTPREDDLLHRHDRSTASSPTSTTRSTGCSARTRLPIRTTRARSPTTRFIEPIGAIVMGSTTYEWILRHHVDRGEPWIYDMPCWVFTHRDLRAGRGRGRALRLGRRRRRCTPRWPRPPAAGPVGGGRRRPRGRSSPPPGCSTRSSSRSPRSPSGPGGRCSRRRYDLRLLDLAQYTAFACARYAVVGSALTRRPRRVGVGERYGRACARPLSRPARPRHGRPRRRRSDRPRRRRDVRGLQRRRPDPVPAAGRPGPGQAEAPATATGNGGAVTSVDPYATRIGLRVLRSGGNAADAAVATAAALGVTEPYSAGIGGGGYFVYYDAEDRQGAAPSTAARPRRPAMPHDAFIDPKTGEPYNFSPDLVTSGVSVGVPGTLATWQRALDRWGTRSLAQRRCARPPAWPAAASWSTRPSASRPPTTRALQRVRPDQQALPAQGRGRRGRQHLPQPRPRAHLRPARATRARGLLPRRARRRDRPRRAQAADARSTPTCRSRRASMKRGPEALPRPRPHGRRRSSYRGYDVYGMAPSVQRRHHGRRGAQHPRALRPRRR